MNSIYKAEEESSYWIWRGFKIFWSVKGKENTHPMILLLGSEQAVNIGETILTTLQKKDILFTQ